MIASETLHVCCRKNNCLLQKQQFVFATWTTITCLLQNNNCMFAIDSYCQGNNHYMFAAEKKNNYKFARTTVRWLLPRKQLLHVCCRNNNYEFARTIIRWLLPKQLLHVCCRNNNHKFARTIVRWLLPRKQLLHVCCRKNNYKFAKETITCLLLKQQLHVC